MSNEIFCGQVMHHRLKPVSHIFSYPITNLFIDLEPLPNLIQGSSLFGLNKFKPFSFFDKDYIEPTAEAWIVKVRRALGHRAEAIKEIKVLTTPRFFGYVFNPVSFYFCFLESQKLDSIIVEINNTFSERHLYILDKFEGESLESGLTASHQKAFYVSPFNDLSGTYEYNFKLSKQLLDVSLNIRRNNEIVFRSGIKGALIPFTQKSLLINLLSSPLRLWAAMPLILWQAAKLYYYKKLPVKHKPIPANEMTFVTAEPGLLDRIAMQAILKFLTHIKIGYLSVELPNKESKQFGDPSSLDRGTLVIHDYSFFRKVMISGDIGFGEAFTEGLWDTPDLTGLITLFIKNEKALYKQPSLFSKLGVVRNRLSHLSRKNTPKNSRENIKAHYDLSNDMFSLFLDESMMYSSAIYPREDSSLNEAQLTKIQAIIDRAEIRSSDHVLEIGSGWGGFAIEAARRTGCRITTITLSTEQKRLAEERIQAAGLSNKIDVQLIDYRHISGSFDKIVSIEMIEAVGKEFLGDYFAAISKLLKPGGRAVIQAITIPDQRYETYCRGVDWIQKHIFPGSHIPSLGSLVQAISSRTSLLVQEVASIGLHYARTLKEWRIAFNKASQTLSDHRFNEEFQRAWNYYFAYCEAGFATSALNDIHLVLSKPKSDTLNP
jgi:cyclopropane-fatty-acyl-phospholipid synthase